MRWATADGTGCSWAGARCRAECAGLSLQEIGAAGPSGAEAAASSRLLSPSPPRAGSSECGLTASVPLSDAGVQTEGASQRAGGGADCGRALAELRQLGRVELQARKALANACGSELTILLACALRQEVAARASGKAALRAEQAVLRGAAAEAESRLTVAWREAVRERDAAREELCAAATAKHSAQRRHASASLRVAQLEGHAAQLQLRFQCLAEEHSAALQRADRVRAELLDAADSRDAAQAQLAALSAELSAALEEKEHLRDTVRTLRQSSADLEARAAGESVLRDTIARLRGELGRSADQCGRYARQLHCHRELQGIGAAEAAWREALAEPLCGAVQQLRPEPLERGRIMASEASRRNKMQHFYRYTGPMGKHADGMPASRALRVDTICHGVAVYVPEDWAPVCSSAARASLAVMRAHSLGWKAGEAMLGPFRSRGAESGFDEQNYGPEPGLLHGARLAIDSLKRDVMMSMNTADAAGTLEWKEWHGRWLHHIDMQANMYAEARLRHHGLFLTCRCLAQKAAGAAARIEAALTTYVERTEAEGGEQ